MGADVIGRFDVMPIAGPLPLSVLNHDGEHGQTFGRHGAEVVIVSETSDPAERLVVTVDFRTIDQANRAGQLLADAFAAVTAIRDEPLPEHCDHRVRLVKFSRALPPAQICELCGVELAAVA